MINENTAQFLEKNKTLLAEENFDQLYSMTRTSKTVDAKDLTEVLLGVGVDPLPYFQETVPYAYAAGLPLTSTIIPEPISIIGMRAFLGCNKLVSAYLPKSLKLISYKAFCRCSMLSEINFPDSLSNIGSNAFEFCSSLTKVKFPDSLRNIGEGAFYDCDKLEQIEFGSKLDYIHPKAFQLCSSLPSVIFPGSLDSIAPESFADCDSLRELTFLGSVPPTLGTKAFANCPVELIHFEGSTTTWRSTINTTAFSPSTQIKVICRNGEIFKRSQDSEWRE